MKNLRTGRKDEVKDEIVAAFKAMGCGVVHLAWPVDLAVSTIKNGTVQNLFVECKTPKRGKLTPSQKKFFGEWRGPLYVVESGTDAVDLVRMLRER